MNSGCLGQTQGSFVLCLPPEGTRKTKPSGLCFKKQPDTKRRWERSRNFVPGSGGQPCIRRTPVPLCPQNVPQADPHQHASLFSLKSAEAASEMLPPMVPHASSKGWGGGREVTGVKRHKLPMQNK